MAKKKFTQEDISKAIYHHARTGRPEKANKIRALVAAGEEVPGDLLDLSGVRSERPVEEKLEIPARNASTEEWAEFGAKVSDFDEAVLSKMGRAEIIEVLEQRDIIPTVEEAEAQAQAEAEEEANQEEGE